MKKYPHFLLGSCPNMATDTKFPSGVAENDGEEHGETPVCSGDRRSESASDRSNGFEDDWSDKTIGILVTQWLNEFVYGIWFLSWDLYIFRWFYFRSLGEWIIIVQIIIFWCVTIGEWCGYCTNNHGQSWGYLTGNDGIIIVFKWG